MSQEEIKKYKDQLRQMFGDITDDDSLTNLAVALTGALAELSVYLDIPIPHLVIGLSEERLKVMDALKDVTAKQTSNEIIKKVFPNADLI